MGFVYRCPLLVYVFSSSSSHNQYYYCPFFLCFVFCVWLITKIKFLKKNKVYFQTMVEDFPFHAQKQRILTWLSLTLLTVTASPFTKSWRCRHPVDSRAWTRRRATLAVPPPPWTWSLWSRSLTAKNRAEHIGWLTVSMIWLGWFGVGGLKLLLLGHGGVKISERKIESERVEGEVGAQGQAGKRKKK